MSEHTEKKLQKSNKVSKKLNCSFISFKIYTKHLQAACSVLKVNLFISGVRIHDPCLPELRIHVLLVPEARNHVYLK